MWEKILDEEPKPMRGQDTNYTNKRMLVEKVYMQARTDELVSEVNLDEALKRKVQTREKQEG